LAGKGLLDGQYSPGSAAHCVGASAIVAETSKARHKDEIPKHSSHPFDLLVDRFAQLFADRIAASLPKATPRDGAARRVGAPRGIKRDMRCRYPGCKNRSKGPRFRFFCEEHLKLPKKQQDAALAKWAGKNT
jgi:hypothetical protein